jgi:deazaflavin-dependent oxidoreductase (nitroreductase family)
VDQARLAEGFESGGPPLETVGRRTGQMRATPVLYLRDGDALVVLAANAGADRTPAWWLNLREAGFGQVILGRSRMRVRPRFTDREMPLIALEPATA